MNLIQDAIYAMKVTVSLSLDTPLLLRSGQTGDVTDSTIERVPDLGSGDRLSVNGYVWASLLRRALQRFPEGKDLAGRIGKYQDREGVSPLWCEQTVAALHATAVNPGNRISRKWGAVESNALFNDELAVAGLPLDLRFVLFAPDAGTAKSCEAALLKALSVVHDGVENIGGGWTYGYGRLNVREVGTVTLDLRKSTDREQLWRWEDDVPWTCRYTADQLPRADTKATVIRVEARVADGQLLAIKSAVFPLDPPASSGIPDTFVFRRNRLVEGNMVQEPVIPGKAIRQALFSVPLERRWRSAGETACVPDTARNKCTCRRCRWFGNTQQAGVVAVTDAPLTGYKCEVVNRLQLCEHSMQNMNLFSGEYLTGGTFAFRIVIDESRIGSEEDRLALLAAITSQLDELAGKDSPPGWNRLGGTSTCTGQVQVTGYTISRSEQP